MVCLQLTPRGAFTIDGLHATNLADYADVQPGGGNQYIKYALVEVKAPNGYERNSTPIKFEVKAKQIQLIKNQEKWKVDADGTVTSTEVTTSVENIAVKDVTDPDTDLNLTVGFVNVKRPELPLTGGAGIALFGILGVAIVAGGLYVTKRNAKRSAELS